MSKSQSIFLALLIGLCFTAFGQKKVLLQLNLEVGDTYQMVTEMQNEVVQTIMGMDQKIAQDITQYMSYKVLGVNSNGSFRIQLTFDRVILKSSQPGMESSFDSNQDANPSDPQAMGYAAMLDIPFELEMKKTGEVVKFVGFEKAIDKILEQQNITDPEQQKSVRETLAETINDETLVNQLSISTTFPEKKLGIGDSWVKEAEVNTGNFPLMTSTTYTVKEINTEQVVLNISSSLATDPDAEPMNANGMMMSAELAGTQTGTIIVKKNNGWVSSSKIDQVIEGSMSVQPSPQLPDGMTWPMKITSSIITRPGN